ncbi:hypothetical protein L3Q82_014582 [Scortum barcoo]|uniref:Uncharacterized protein n=1 Tax=Scortum barcoo TaxID=214431 RepID=A0ACB8VYI2_9TELE|nr:hypothetical protein L3Q82_014582 [Scortum barcoo]
MKCFERIVLKHIKDIIPFGLDQYQFAYRENRSTEDAVSIALHTALTHLQLPNTYVRMLFVDFSSAFNTVIPDKLILKLHNLGLPSSLCHWIRDFLTNRPQVVRIGDNTSSTLVLSTGTPQGCVLSPALFTLFTSDCSAIYSTNTIVKFADDTNRSGPHIRTMMRPTTERRSSILLSGAQTTILEAVERVNNIKFLGIHITSDLTWSMNTAHLVKKAQQRLFFLRKLKRAGLSPQLLTNFYRATIESILCLSAAVWYGSCTAQDQKDLVLDGHSKSSAQNPVVGDRVEKMEWIPHPLSYFFSSNPENPDWIFPSIAQNSFGAQNIFAGDKVEEMEWGPYLGSYDIRAELRRYYSVSDKVQDMMWEPYPLSYYFSFKHENSGWTIPYPPTTSHLELLTRSSRNSKRTTDNLTADHICTLLDLCLNTTYYPYREGYRQKHGFDMGSPVSLIVANLYMAEVESKALTSFTGSSPSQWSRYVDDIMSVFSLCICNNWITAHVVIQYNDISTLRILRLSLLINIKYPLVDPALDSWHLSQVSLTGY